MKKIILFILLLIAISGVNGQIAFYDAQKIKKFITPNDAKPSFIVSPLNSDSVLKILVKYVKNTNKNTTNNQVLDAFKNNPFIGIYSPTNQDVLIGLGDKDNSPKKIDNILLSGASSIGGLDVTNITQGLSIFMIDRAKQEMTIAFFNKFKKFVTDTNYEEIQVLLPKTAETIEHLLSYQYPQMLPAIRAAFNEDLEMLPAHLSELLRLPKYAKLLKAYPQIGLMIGSLRMVYQMENGDANPAEMLKQFAELPEWSIGSEDKDFKNINNGVKLAKIFSESLRSNDIDSFNPWISSKDLKNLLKDKIAFQIYLGLIYQQVQNEDIKFQKSDGEFIFKDEMQKHIDTITFYQSYLNRFIIFGERIDGITKDIKHKKELNEKITNDDCYNYIETGIGVLEISFDFAKIFDENFKTEKYISLARAGNDLYKNIYKQEYGLAIFNTVNILTDIIALFDKNKNEVFGKLKNKIINDSVKSDSLINKDLKQLLKDKKIKNLKIDDKRLDKIIDKVAPNEDLKKSIKKNELYSFLEEAENVNKLKDLLPGLSQYGIFISNIVQAKTPEEVKEVIESAALPVGSSSIKKNSCFNIALQSYLGAYYNPFNKSSTSKIAWTDKFGVSAPVGVSFSYGLKKAGALSLFVSLIDIGAIVDYDLKVDSTNGVNVSKDYKIKLGQIFSPGLYLVYGFPCNVPLSLGFGGQYGPGLGKIESNGGTVINNPSWRWSVFLSVDIPIFNFLNTTRKK